MFANADNAAFFYLPLVQKIARPTARRHRRIFWRFRANQHWFWFGDCVRTLVILYRP